MKSLFLVLFLSFFINCLSITEPNIIKIAVTVKNRVEDIKRIHSKYIIFIDYDQPETVKRLYVIDSSTNQIVFRAYVTHGIGSGSGHYATSFSNEQGSKKTSLGAYLVQGAWQSSRHGACWRLQGIEKYNSNAYNRMIELHGANYAGPPYYGKSWGCFAVSFNDLATINHYVSKNTIIISYNHTWANSSSLAL
jgi:hypothetical protein